MWDVGFSTLRPLCPGSCTRTEEQALPVSAVNRLLQFAGTSYLPFPPTQWCILRLVCVVRCAYECAKRSWWVSKNSWLFKRYYRVNLMQFIVRCTRHRSKRNIESASYGEDSLWRAGKSQWHREKCISQAFLVSFLAEMLLLRCIWAQSNLCLCCHGGWEFKT